MSPHWFQPVAEHLGEAYLRYSFTRGTVQEVEFLCRELALEPGDRVLDLGCGPGRHSAALAERSVEVVGIDVSSRFLSVARDRAPSLAQFVCADARALPLRGGFDAVISLCQGAFGLGGPVFRHGEDRSAPPPGPDPDEMILAQVASALRPGGRLALTAFSAYFQVKGLEEGDEFDPATGLNRESTSVRDPSGEELEVDLWTTCFTPRELRLLAERSGLRVLHIWAVRPAGYGRRPPDLEHPELLLMAERPAG